MKIGQIFCDDVLEDYAYDYEYVITMFIIMIRIMIMIMLLHFFKWWRHNKFWVDVIFQKKFPRWRTSLIQEEAIALFEVIAVPCFRMLVFVFENIPAVCMLVFREV